MTVEEIQQIQEIIQTSIKSTVNGKIDRIDEKLEKYIDEDNKWKSEVMPTINQTKKIMDFADVGSVVLKTLVLIGSIVTGLWGLLTFINNIKK